MFSSANEADIKPSCLQGDVVHVSWWFCITDENIRHVHTICDLVDEVRD